MKSVLLILLLASCSHSDRSTEDSGSDGKQLFLSEPYNGDIELFPVAEVSYHTLIGGVPADRTKWPASFTTSQGNSRCTGTLLGPQVLQLAAHCAGNGGTASIVLGGKKYASVCTHHSKYQSDSTSDYALCKISEPVAVEWYESVVQKAVLKVGDKLTLAGMGCTQPGGGGGNHRHGG